MTNVTQVSKLTGDGIINGSVLTSPNHKQKNGGQETTNLITIEAKQDIIKVETN
jgi:hypothetical protein